jgi:hypothetical protein
MPLEGSLDDAALNPSPASVNQPYFGEARLRGGVHILLDD